MDNSSSQVINIIQAQQSNSLMICNFYFLGDGFCSYETFISPDDRGIYNWTETAVATPPTVHVLDCFYEPQDEVGMARRVCRSNNTWSHPDDLSRTYDGDQCVTNGTYQLRLLSRVSRSNMDMCQII